MAQAASDPDLELKLRQRAAQMTALMLGQRYRVRHIQSLAARIALFAMLMTIACLVWFSLRMGAPRQMVVDRALGVSFDMPTGWRRVEAHQFTRFLQGNFQWVPDALLQEIADHLSHPDYGLVLVPADSGRPFIVISKRNRPTAPLTQLSASRMFEGELVHFSQFELGPVSVLHTRGSRIFSMVSSTSLDTHKLLIRHDYVIVGENAYVLTWVGPAGDDVRVLDGVSGSLGEQIGSTGSRWVAAGVIQLWLLFLVVGLAFVALQIYRRMG